MVLLTGGEDAIHALAEGVALLRVQPDGVVGVGLQVGEPVLGHVPGDALLLGVGALHGHEEAVACHGGPWGRPDQQGAVLGDVIKAQVAGGVRLWREQTKGVVC